MQLKSVTLKAERPTLVLKPGLASCVYEAHSAEDYHLYHSGRGGSPLQNVAGGLHISVFARFISLWKADHALRVAESSDLSGQEVHSPCHCLLVEELDSL